MSSSLSFLSFLQIVYFTATFPYLILVCLFFRAVTLDGAGDGLKFLFLPDKGFQVFIAGFSPSLMCSFSTDPLNFHKLLFALSHGV